MRLTQFSQPGLNAFTRVALSMILLGGLASSINATTFTPISLSGVANDQLSLLFAPSISYPIGATTLGGVPFNIPTSGNNIFNANIAADQGPSTVTLTLPINLSGVTEVNTLINTGWGQAGPDSLVSLTFTFGDGSQYVDPLIGGVDIRDHFSGAFTNTINGTSTVNVFTTNEDGHAGPGDYRMDMQSIDLSDFTSKTLASITLTDTGNFEVQRAYLFGLTVQTVPEPSSIALATVAFGGLIACGWRRRTARKRRHAEADSPLR